MRAFNLEAEQGVIGALLIDPSSWEHVSGAVAATDFYRDDHRRIFSACAEILERGETPDVITVGELMQDVGGIAYVGTLVSQTPSASSAGTYARIVREHAIRRQAVAAADWIIQHADNGDVATMLDQAQTRLMAVGESVRTTEPVSIRESAKTFIKELERRVESGGGITGLETGFEDLDEITAGLHPADLVIVAGRPSSGKTTLAMNLVEQASVRDGKPSMVFSLEMPAAHLTERMTAAIGRISLQSLRTGKLEEDDWPKISRAVGMINDAPVVIDDSSGLTISELRARARRTARKMGGLSLVVVDYLQLMAGDGENRNLEVADISRGLKGLAKELNCPVIAISQLNRSVEQRSNKRPMMSDLRDSGAVEQDADLILFVYRDEVYNDDSPDKGTAEIIIGKQRNGPIGTVRLAFLGQYNRFENLAPDWQPVPQEKPQRTGRSRSFYGARTTEPSPFD